MRPTFMSLAASESQCFPRTHLSDSAWDILTRYFTAYWAARPSERGAIVSDAAGQRQERGVPLPGELIDSWLRRRRPGPFAIFPRLSEYGIARQFPPTPLLRSRKPEGSKVTPRSFLSSEVIFSCESVPNQVSQLRSCACVYTKGLIPP
jgi:hypothetical protein